jgi:hypothetical protein
MIPTGNPPSSSALRGAEAILADLKSLGWVSGGEVYLPIEAAVRLVTECTDRFVAIVGAEAFHVEGRDVRPRVDLIADFSMVLEGAQPWEAKVARTTTDAARFVEMVRRQDPSLFVNFVLADRDESEVS